MKHDRHWNRQETLCLILGTECDNPKGCLGCYHQQVEDYRAYYAGEAAEPYKEHEKRLRNEHRKI